MKNVITFFLSFIGRHQGAASPMSAMSSAHSVSRALRLVAVAAAVWGALASDAQAWWTALYDTGSPIYTNYWVGDSHQYVYEFAVNQDTSGWTVEYGMGTTANGSGWGWKSAAWSRMDGPNNRVWKSNANEFQFTSAGNWYYAGRFTSGGTTEYAVDGWASGRTSFSTTSHFRVNALIAPSPGSAVTNVSNPATAVDLSWTKWNSKSALITYSTASPSGSPTQGSAYSSGGTFGNQTVVAGSDSSTTRTVSGLTPGQTYYFTFYSENYSYYSTGSTVSVALSMPNARNTAGGASPGAPAGTTYLGDSAKVFSFESWGKIESNWGRSRLWLRQGNGDLTGGTAGDWTGFTDQDAKSGTSGVFNATGTWYWGFQMDYASPYGTGFWYKASSASWAPMAANGTSASLSLSVSALTKPSGQSATRSGSSPLSAIDLAWTRGVSGSAKDTMIVRSTSSSFTAPTQGSAYAVNASLGAGTVIYKGSGTATTSSGLSQGTTYYYAFYAVNNDYYSDSVVAGTNTATRPTDATWDGGGADNNTLTEANWVGDLYPAAGASSVMRFAGSTRTSPSINHAANSDFGSIYFNSGASAFTIGGNAIKINSLVQNDSANLQTVNVNAELASNTTVNAVSGDVKLGGVLSGSKILTKSGAKALTLSGNNTFSGGLSQSASGGTLNINHNNALGSGAYTIASGNTFDNTSGGSISANNDVAIKAATTFGGSNPLTLGGTINLGSANRTLTVSGSTLTLSGNITVSSGTRFLTKAGNGTLTISGNNSSWTGGVTLSAGTLNIGHANALGMDTFSIGAATLDNSTAGALTVGNAFSLTGNSTFTGSQPLTLSGAGTLTGNRTVTVSANELTISGAVGESGGSRSLTKVGAGTLTLSGNNTFAGGVTISAGRVNVNHANALGSGTFTPGGNTFGNTSGGAITVANAIDGNANFTFAGTSPLTFNGAAGTWSGTRTYQIDAGTLTLNGAIAENAAGRALIKNGNGTLAFGGQNTYSGPARINAGTFIYMGTNTSSDVGIGSTAFFYGNGSIGGLISTGQVSAGSASNSVGSLRVTSMEVKDDSVMQVDISAMTGTAGTDWDVITSGGGAGDLKITASSTHPLVIRLKGSPTFSNTTPYTNVLVDAGSLTSFTTNDVSINTDEFTPSLGTGAFEVRDIGGDLCLVFVPGPSEPTVQATGISFSAVATNAMTLTWTNGNGATRLVVGHAGAAVDSNPVDGTTYTANSTFGSGTQIGTGNYVVYSGTGNSVAVGGLSAGTVYHFRVYEFNGSGGGEDYLTSTASGNPSNHTTLALEPTTQASTVTFTSVGTTSMTVGWTSGNGANRLVILRQSFAPNADPVDGTAYTADSDFSGSGSSLGGGKVVYAGSGSSFSLTGLDPESLYYAQVYEYNGSGASLNYMTNSATGNPDSRRTLSLPPSSHASAFTATAVSDTQINLGWTSAGAPRSGYLIIRRTGADPTGSPSDGSAYSAGDTIGDGTVAAVVTSGAAVSVDITGLSASTEYHFLIFPYNWDGSDSESINYLTTGTVPAANDTTFAAQPSTQATSITLSSRTKDSISLSWTSGNGANRVVVAHEASAVDSDPVDGTGYTANATFGSGTQIGTGNYVVYSGSGNSVTVSGLKTNTTYHFRAYEFNGSSATANYNTNTASGNPASFSTADNEPGIGVGSGISVSTTLGSSPAASAFVITNIGGSALSYVLSDNVAWLTLAPTTATNMNAGQTTTHTGTYNAVGLHVGTSNGTITVTQTGGGENAATNSPKTIPVTLTINAIPDPTGVSAAADGSELVRLAWTKNPSYDVVIVYDTSAISTEPTGGVALNVGDSLGTGKVIYKGGGGTFEHVVPAGSSAHYKFYSINNDYYSAGVSDNESLSSYPASEILDQGGYTNGVNLSGLSGGQGWTNAWSTSGSGTWMIQTNYSDSGTDVPRMPIMVGYPTTAANRMKIDSLSNNDAAFALRSFARHTSGNIYVAALMSFRYYGGGGSNDRYFGMSLFDGGSEKAFIGRAGGNSVLAIDSTGSAKTESGYTLNGTESGAGGSTGNVYLIIAKYDFAGNKVYAKAYYRTDAVSGTEPLWEITNTPSASISGIDTIRIGGGGYNGASIGAMWFDEVRVATSWVDLVRGDKGAPYATNYLVNGGVNVTDGQILDGTYSVVMDLRSGSGIESVNTTSPFFKPDFDIWNPSGIQVITNQVFGSFSYLDSGRTLRASNTTHSGVARDDVVLGVYTSRWSAIGSNAVASINVTTLSNGTPMAFTVVDDDTAAPTIVTIQSPDNSSFRYMHVSSNGGSMAGSGAGTGITYTVTDGFLAEPSIYPITFYLGAIDAGSGLSRGTSNPEEQSNLSIGNTIISNVGTYVAAESSAYTNTYGPSATNVYKFTLPFTSSEIGTLITETAFGDAGVNPVFMTWRDADFDRPNDRMSLSNQVMGFLKVTDDDTVPPTIQNFRIWGSSGSFTVRVDELSYGTGWAITGRVSDAGSGINVNGASTTQPDSSPYFELWDSTGNLKLREAFDTLSFAHGGAKTLSAIGDFSNTAIASPSIGTWTARVIVADADVDWPGDRSFATNEFSFVVVPGTASGGIGRGPASITVTSDYGTVSGPAPWPNLYVTNIGSGMLTYSHSISYASAGGWLSLSPTGASLMGTGTKTNHTMSVDASSLNPGLYQATITLNGDQTNAAQTVVVNLEVKGYFAGEIVDQFTNAVSNLLHGTVGGTGWTNAWDDQSTTNGFGFSSPSLGVPANYPAAAGNKVCADSANDGEIKAYRYFKPFTTGSIYVAVAVTKSDGNSDGFNGISLMNDGTEVAFAGKLYNSEKFGIEFGQGNGGPQASDFGVNGPGSTYFYIARYDFETGKMYGRAFNASDTLSLSEPTWGVTNTPNTPLARINGIRIAAKNDGVVCFDEIRVATTWENLLNIFSGEPLIHASAMSFQNITTNSMNVGWNPGNGAARIVVARQGSAVSWTPTDHTGYAFSSDFSAGTDLGSGNKVVYNGSGTNFAFTGLNPQTQYYFAIFEYNGAGATSDYNTNFGFAVGDRWTVSPEAASNPTGFGAFPASDTQITNSWTASAGSPAPSGYLILRSLNPIVDVPADGVAYTNGQGIGAATVLRVTPGSATSASHTSLNSCSPYYFQIFAYTWDGSHAQTYNYNTSGAPTADAETSCETPSVQASNIVFTFTATNRIQITWERGSGLGSLVVVRGTNPVNQNPINGTTYTANDTYGSGSHLGNGNYVVYSGTGTTVMVSGLQPGTVYEFRVYEYNGAGAGIDYNVNTAANNPRSTATASFGLVEDKFIWNYFGNYGNNNLSGAGTGTGWTNSWSTFGGYVAVDDANSPAFKGYPADTRSGCGNNCDDSRQVKITTISGTDYGATRGFPARTSGKLVMAAKFNLQNTPTNGWAGLSFMDGTNEVAFLGKGWGVSNGLLTLDDTDGHTTTTPLNTNTTWTLYGGSPYLLVFEYDFDTKTLAGRAYTTNDLPHTNPDAEVGWNVVLTNVNISSIDGIRFGGQNVGDLIVDHIRIAPSWEEVVWGLPANWHKEHGPVPTLVYIGTNYGPAVYSQVITNLSDAELNSQQLIDFAVRWDATDGIFVKNSGTNFIASTKGRVTPNWDPLAVGITSNEFGLDQFFTNYFGANGALSVTTYQKSAFNITNLDFEVQYFVTVSAETDPSVGDKVTAPAGGDDVPVRRALTINAPLRFYVYDDDANAPLRGTRPLRVMTNSSVASAQSVGNNLERYFVYDGMLPQTGMRLSLGAYDEYSGLRRSAVGTPATNMTISVPFVTTNDHVNYKSALSSQITTVPAATSVWEFAGSYFTYSVISDMWGGDGKAPQGNDIEITANIPDADADRTDDQMWASNQVMGYLRIIDDDVAPPDTSNVVFTGAAGRSFFALTNGFAIGSGDTLIRNTYSRRSGTTSNTIFAVTDEELARSGARALQFAFGAVDKESGVMRGTSGSTNDVMSFSIGDAILGGTSVIARWSAALSTAGNGPGVVQTNFWTFPNGFFSESVITQLMEVTGSSGTSQALVRVTIPDSDNDRVNDTTTLYSEQVGFLRVFDDDVAGPQMTDATVAGSESGGILLSTSFETEQGWPGSLASGTAWTNTDSYGKWVGVGVTLTSLDPKHTGTRRIGLLTNNVPEVPPYIQLPPIDAPGQLSVYASRVAGGSGDPVLRLEWRDENAWVSLGDMTVTGINTNWQSVSWQVELYEPGVTMRIVRVDNGEQRTQVYLDDLSVNGNPEWISTNQLTFSWKEAVDDYSGINYYKVVPPALNAPVPTTTNDGVWISAAVTSGVADITGMQGVITGYVFAVDDDADRSNDNMMGNVIPLLARVDTNPPLAILNATNDINDLTVDETSELKITWTPSSTNMHRAAGWRQSDSAPLSPWETYVVFVYELDGNMDPITTNVITYTNGPANLDDFETGSIIVSNLNFDTYHRISVAGRDRAGNLGPLVTVTGMTVNFQVTQGWARTTAMFTNAVRLAWIAASNRVYDQLYVDAASMTDSMSNRWDWMARVTNNIADGNTLFDAGGDNPTNRLRVAPGELGGPTMRFYRVSQKDTWRPEQGARRVSREVYVTKPLQLTAGENWYSTFFVPDTGTVSYIFGNNRLPSGSDYASATKIHWFAPNVMWRTNQLYSSASNTVALIGGNWMKWGGGDWDVLANNDIIPLAEGFMIEMPPGSPAINLPIVGRVSTNEIVVQIPGAVSGQTNTYVRSWGYPYRASLADLKLVGSGMLKAPVRNLQRAADELRILRNGDGGGSFEQPDARWYINNDNTWTLISYNTNTYRSAPSAATFRVEPDDALIFLRRGTDTIYWTNKLYYTPPGKSFDP